MITIDSHVLPVYFGSAAFAAAIYKTGSESVSSFSKAFFQKTDHSSVSRQTHFGRGIRSLVAAAAFTTILYFLSRPIQIKTTQGSAFCLKNKISICQKQWINLQTADDYTDLTQFYPFSQFCSEYELSTQAYQQFLSQNETNSTLSEWVLRIRPYFTFIEWQNKTIEQAKSTFKTHFEICKFQFDDLILDFTQEILHGVHLNLALICDSLINRCISVCSEYIELKNELLKFKKEKSRVDGLVGEINTIYQVNRCKENFYFQSGEFPTQLVDKVCSKLPLNQTRLCSSWEDKG